MMQACKRYGMGKGGMLRTGAALAGWCVVVCLCACGGRGSAMTVAASPPGTLVSLLRCLPPVLLQLSSVMPPCSTPLPLAPHLTPLQG
jgi:hypothetical protein